MKPRVKLKALELLKSGTALTKYTLAEAAPCHPKRACEILTGLHKDGLIRIRSWVPIYQHRIPEYVFGKGQDARKPRPKTKAELSRKYRKNPEFRLAETLQKRKKRAVITDRILAKQINTFGLCLN